MGRIILSNTNPEDTKVEDLRPGQVAIFGNLSKNGNLTMKRKDGTLQDLAEGGGDLTTVVENTDVTKIDSFSEVIEIVNSSTESNFNNIYPKWVNYSLLVAAPTAIADEKGSGISYSLEFTLSPQVRLGSEQILRQSGGQILPTFYETTESPANPGFIEKITISGIEYDEPVERTRLDIFKGAIARELHDTYDKLGLADFRNTFIAIYGVSGAIQVLNFINPDVEKDKITAELQEIVDNCDSVLNALSTQLDEVGNNEANAVEEYNVAVTGLREQEQTKTDEIAVKNEDIAKKQEEIATAQAAEPVDDELVTTLQNQLTTLQGELNTLKEELETIQTNIANLDNQRKIDRDLYLQAAEDLKNQIAAKEKECDSAKKQLEELQEDISSVSDTIRVKTDDAGTIILPRVEYLYLTDDFGNRIRTINSTLEKSRYADLAFQNPKGVDYRVAAYTEGSDINTSSIILKTVEETPATLTKENFESGIWIISVEDFNGEIIAQQKKILSFDRED